MSQAAKPRGRPPTGEVAKRHVVAIRATQALREKVDRAASAAGRSMSQEIEFRLEQSFDNDQRAGSPATAALMKLIVGTVEVIEAQTGKRWIDDYKTYSAVSTAIQEIYEKFEPPLPSEFQPAAKSAIALLDERGRIIAAADKLSGLKHYTNEDLARMKSFGLSDHSSSSATSPATDPQAKPFATVVEDALLECDRLQMQVEGLLSPMQHYLGEAEALGSKAASEAKHSST